MNILFRRLIIGAVAFLAFIQPGWAQTFPMKPITLIVPLPAGGSTDVVLRAMADIAGKELGQPIVVDNRPGGSGVVAASILALAKPDGYTIGQMAGPMLRLPLMQTTSYDPATAFSYIILLTGYPFGITTRTDSPFKTWNDVENYAKDNPGKVTYATSGISTTPHLGMEQIAAKAGIKLTVVPFKGGAETNAAILGGHTMLQVDATTWKPLVDAGKLRVLMMWTATRTPAFPDVPTAQDLGFPYVFDSPFGLAAPKGVAPEIVKKLHDAFKIALDHPNVRDALTKFDMIPNYKSTSDYGLFITDTLQQERAMIERLGLKR